MKEKHGHVRQHPASDHEDPDKYLISSLCCEVVHSAGVDVTLNVFEKLTKNISDSFCQSCI